MSTPSRERYPQRIQATMEVLAHQLGDLLKRADERVIVGICGAPGAGKSTLAEGLIAHLGAGTAALVPYDGFHLARNLLRGTPLENRRGAIDTFDNGSFLALMRRLRARDEDVVYAPTFDRVLEDPIASAIPIPREIPLIITEGNYLLSDDQNLREARSLIDTVWFLDTPMDLRLPQLIARHIEYGMPEDEALNWAEGPDQRNADEINVTRDRADIIISLALVAPSVHADAPE